MPKKVLCIFLLILLCLPAFAEDEVPSRLYHFTSAAEAPYEIAAGIADLFGPDIAYIDGYATLRFGRWCYGQAIMQDEQGYILCGFTYSGDDDHGSWNIEYSRTALRADILPQLLPEAVEYGYDNEQVSQFDGCHQFKIIYDDLIYHWFCGTYGWILNSIVNPAENLKLSISTQAVTRYLADSGTGYTPQAQAVFNVLSPSLKNFDISAFPTTWEAAETLSAASPYADSTKAVTVYTPWDYDHFGIEYADGIPLIRLYASPSRDSQCIAQVFDYVETEILDHKDYSTANIVNDWYMVRIHNISGWIQRDNLLIGSERAAAWHWMGETAMVYGSSAQTEQFLYTNADKTASAVRIPVNTRIHAQLITDDSWCLVRDDQEQYGWMEPDTVCMTDNLHDGYIYSEDPARRLNLRKGPGTQYDAVGKYYSGVRVVFMLNTQPVHGWSRVSIEGVTGYVDNDFILTYSDYTGREWLPPLGKVQKVNSKGLNLRTAPSKNAEIITACPVGTSVEILGIYDSVWAHVRLQDGACGYMMLQYLGGEPAKAAGNSFSLLNDTETVDYLGKTLFTLRKNTRVRAAERPIIGKDEALWIISDDKYGFIPADAAKFW